MKAYLFRDKSAEYSWGVYKTFEVAHGYREVFVMLHGATKVSEVMTIDSNNLKRTDFLCSDGNYLHHDYYSVYDEYPLELETPEIYCNSL